jgi:Spy/CpxP family protein refolding chaperone
VVFRQLATWLCGVVLLAAPLAWAAAEQNPPRPTKWWLSTEGRAAVGITDRQSAEIERVFQAVLPELRAEKAALEHQERELTRLLGTDGTDEATVVRAIDRVEAARSALAKTRTLMLYRMRRVLAPEQRVRLDEYHKRQDRQATESRHEKKF